MRAPHLVLLPLALLCGAGAAHAQSAGLEDPVTLFNTACIGGQARLSRTKFDDVAYAVMPRAARTLFGLALDGAKATPPVAPGDLDVPNRVMVTLPERDLYLLLPATGAPGRAAEACSVVWQGNHQADAQAAVEALVSGTKPVATPALPAGTRFVSYRHSGSVLTAAELDQWTVLSIVSEPAPKERTTP
ncbi:hypothetical protein [Sphingomonas hengshuiensis]|uniref:Uncharacterized protein n=1 Tax=Sphingomonas hengshuiensis TaxID=1609977 RepID=A0A7U4LH51_9SPHN|nr:hypothetical protein [Sphingomonas hengshuiensis]AJP73814.1 hypothetical protein TS85_21460 [Sphingomonas hengshuiensis]